jgi:hypothetical protein
VAVALALLLLTRGTYSSESSSEKSDPYLFFLFLVPLPGVLLEGFSGFL